MKALIAHGGELNAQDRSGRTPLHKIMVSYSRGVARVIQLFLKHGASISIADSLGATPVYYQARATIHLYEWYYLRNLDGSHSGPDIDPRKRPLHILLAAAKTADDPKVLVEARVQVVAGVCHHWARTDIRELKTRRARWRGIAKARAVVARAMRRRAAKLAKSKIHTIAASSNSPTQER